MPLAPRKIDKLCVPGAADPARRRRDQGMERDCGEAVFMDGAEPAPGRDPIGA